jgi:hypothetical protein
MTETDLTIAEVLKDPMIRLMMRADGVSLEALKTLLIDAALRQRRLLLDGGEHQEVPRSIAGQTQARMCRQQVNAPAQACL